MKNKMNKYRKINAIICIILAISLMLFIYNDWNKDGSYTACSFILSLIFHGCPFLVIGYFIDEKIIEHFRNKK